MNILIEEADRLYHENRYEEALAKYRELAEQGYPGSAHRIAWMTMQGLGTPKDYNEGMRWYKIAAEAGSPVAQFDLANEYTAVGDYQNALPLLERATAQSYTPAVYRLGWHYKLGKGVEVDEQKAFCMFKEAAGRGHLWAQKQLARRMLKGHEGLIGRLKGFWRLLKLPFIGLKVALKNKDDERLRD